MTHREACPALGRVLVVAVIFLVLSPLAVSAPPDILQPVKRHPGAGPTPLTTAQIQIARLRQTADQLRLLARQPLPADVGNHARAEFTRHEQWLREAEHRVSVLADNWEQRLRPSDGVVLHAGEIARALDLNAFFEAQMAGLQSKLRSESARSAFVSEPVRAANDTAKVIINQMN